MPDFLSLAAGNLLSPMVLFFVLGAVAAFAKSDLTVPEALAKGLALYLMLAIGFKGGAALAEEGLRPVVVAMLALGLALSFLLPFLAFVWLRWTTRLSAIDAAAVAAHYGSISVVTFVAATEFLRLSGLPFAGSMVAVMAVMETPAIMAGLFLAGRAGSAETPGGPPVGAVRGDLMREVLLNGSVVLLVGSFLIGWVTGPAGMTAIAPFIEAPFKGVLCLFLLDMGLVAARRFDQARRVLTPALVGYAIGMPVVAAVIGTGAAALIGLDPGSIALFGVLAASASYIAVPAAMRLALPEASPSISLTLSLGLTFPFNLAVGIPLYTLMAGWWTG